MNKMRGMGGHMTASLLTEARGVRAYFDWRIQNHEDFIAELESTNPLETIFRRIAADLGFRLTDKGSRTIGYHRSAANNLRNRRDHKIGILRERLKDRGYYGTV